MHQAVTLRPPPALAQQAVGVCPGDWPGCVSTFESFFLFQSQPGVCLFRYF